MAQYVYNPNQKRSAPVWITATSYIEPDWSTEGDGDTYRCVFQLRDYGGGAQYTGTWPDILYEAGPLESAASLYGEHYLLALSLALTTGEVQRYPFEPASADAGNADCKILAVVRPVKYRPDLGTYPYASTGIYARGSGAAGAENYYEACFRRDTSKLELVKMVAGTRTVLGSVTPAAGVSANFLHAIRLECSGTTIRCRAWPVAGFGVAGVSEPSAWDISVTDASVAGAGDVGFVLTQVETVGAKTWAWGELSLFAIGTGSSDCPEPRTFEEKMVVLNADAPKVFLADMDVQYSGASVAKVCISRGEFVSGPTDSPEHMAYEDCITALPRFRVDSPDAFLGRGSSAFGDLTVSNANGIRDEWLTWNWGGRRCDLYVGAPGWQKWDFVLVLSCTIADIYASQRGDLSFRMRDQSDVLRVDVCDTLIGGSDVFKDAKTPVLRGLCYNIEPTLKTAATREYVYAEGHPTSYLGAWEVRDAGLSVTFTLDKATGTFTLAAAEAGRITCDAEMFLTRSGGGAQTTAYAAIARELEERGINEGIYYGSRGSRVWGSNYTTALPVLACGSFGVFFKDGATVLDLIDAIMRGHLTFWGFNSRNQIVFGRVGDVLTAHHALAEDDCQSLKPLRLVHPKNPDTFIYARNWTLQKDGIAGGVSSADRAWFGSDGSSYVTAVAAPANYAITRPSERVLTCLTSTGSGLADMAAAYAGTLAAPSAVFELVTRRNVGRYWLGQYVELTFSRYGFDAGAVALIVGVEDDFDRWETKLKIRAELSSGAPSLFSGTEYADIAEEAA